MFAERKHGVCSEYVMYLTSVFDYPSIAACAAANLAIGTLNGEQLT